MSPLCRGDFILSTQQFWLLESLLPLTIVPSDSMIQIQCSHSFDRFLALSWNKATQAFIFFFGFAVLGGHIWQFSGLISGSALMNHSWRDWETIWSAKNWTWVGYIQGKCLTYLAPVPEAFILCPNLSSFLCASNSHHFYRKWASKFNAWVFSVENTRAPASSFRYPTWSWCWWTSKEFSVFQSWVLILSPLWTLPGLFIRQ